MDIESLQKELQDIKLHRSQKKNGETEKEQKLAIDDNCKASQVAVKKGRSSGVCCRQYTTEFSPFSYLD